MSNISSEESAEGYSIWLIPDKDSSKKITPIISGLSLKYSSLIFEPHITLLKKIPFKNDLPELFKKFFSNENDFYLKSNGIGVDTDFFKCIFLKIEKTKELDLLRKRTEKFLKFEEVHYNPHLSLLYSNIPMEKRVEEASNLSLNIDKIHISKVKLYKTTGKIYDWQEIASISLKKNANV
ncbi:MAG: hypothetical protein ACP5M9_02620 [Candidatus Micrarchaeia archaeon]